MCNHIPVAMLRIFVLFVLAYLAGCSGKKETLPVAADAVKMPYQELDSSVMYSFSGSKKNWILESGHIVKMLADTGHICGVPVKLTVFDSLGKQTSKVLADTGVADASITEITVWGNVFVKAENGVRVKAQKLTWNQKTHRVLSDTYVQLTTAKGDVLRGKGLDAAEDFSSWRFLHDVSGRFPNFRQRVEKGGEF